MEDWLLKLRVAMPSDAAGLAVVALAIAVALTVLAIAAASLTEDVAVVGPLFCPHLWVGCLSGPALALAAVAPAAASPCSPPLFGLGDYWVALVCLMAMLQRYCMVL